MKFILTIPLSLITLFGFCQTESPRVTLIKEQVKVEAMPVYVKASADVATLKSQIAMAKQKQINPAIVVKNYNEGIGKAMGQKTTIAAIEKRLNEAGESYAKVLYLKEQSRLLFEKAAELKIKSEN